MQFFDTAEMYSYFKNEEFVGRALKELPRDKVIISDKFWPIPLPGQDMLEGKLSEAGIRKDLEGSLRRRPIILICIRNIKWMKAPRNRSPRLWVSLSRKAKSVPGVHHLLQERIIENLNAVDVELTEGEYAALNKELGKLTIYGTRDGRDIKKMGTIPDSTIK